MDEVYSDLPYSLYNMPELRKNSRKTVVKNEENKVARLPFEENKNLHFNFLYILYSVEVYSWFKLNICYLKFYKFILCTSSWIMEFVYSI